MDAHDDQMILITAFILKDRLPGDYARLLAVSSFFKRLSEKSEMAGGGGVALVNWAQRHAGRRRPSLIFQTDYQALRLNS